MMTMLYSREQYPQAFQEAWEALPQRDANNSKKAAFLQWKRRIKEGVPQEELLLAAKGYMIYCRGKGIVGKDVVMMGSTFFGPSGRFEGFVELGKPKPLVVPKIAPKEPAEPLVDARPFIRELLEGLANRKASPVANYARAKQG